MAEYSDFLRELTGRMLDEAIDRGEVEFVHEIAAVIPIRALGHILGVPEEHLGRLVELGDRMIIDTDPEIAHVLAGSPEAEAFKYQPFGSEAAAELCALGRPLIAERQTCPREDVLSILANMEIDGRPLSQVELDNNFALFIVAGNETTRQGMALGLLQLIENPWAMDELRADPSLYPTAIDELLRLASPVWHFRRTATEDTEIGGVEIAKGERVVVWFAAANRDPDALPGARTAGADAQARRACGVRPRRSALLHRGAPGAARDRDHGRGARQAGRPDRAASRRRGGSGRTSRTASRSCASASRAERPEPVFVGGPPAARPSDRQVGSPVPSGMAAPFPRCWTAEAHQHGGGHRSEATRPSP